MRKTFLLLILLFFPIFVFSQLELYNSVTREKITGDEGVTLSFTRKGCNFLNVERHYNAFLNWGSIEGYRSSYSTTNNYSYNGSYVYLPCEFLISYSITIRSPNYETVGLSQEVIPNYVGDGRFKVDNYDGEVSTSYISDMINKACEMYDYNNQPVYLVPKKQIIEGSLDVTTKQNNQSVNDLGLLNVKNIAEGLQISEDDVIKLITSGQLKGKKIGEKYFVRKEDFDVFMKK
jgi:excisionase family DNA binding protein